MFYHVIVETDEKVGKTSSNKQYFEYDKTSISEIEARVIKPFLKKKSFQFDGYFLQPKDIKRIAIKETDVPAEQLAQRAQSTVAKNVFYVYTRGRAISSEKFARDITAEVFDRVEKEDTPSVDKEKAGSGDKKKVFIVHGRDNLSKTEAARFIERLGLDAIILHEQVSAGKTIIEKIEEHANVGYAIVIYSPCDMGGIAGDTSNLRARARQNVVFEHGYLIGTLGRRSVSALIKGDIEVPNDISGIVYTNFDEHGAWKLSIARELRSAGYDIDFNNI